MKRLIALSLLACLLLSGCVGKKLEVTEVTTTAPTTEATEPTTEATEPTTEATEPTTEPTQPTEPEPEPEPDPAEPSLCGGF